MIQAPTAMFAALADDTRWAILTRLGEAPASASALARELPVSRQAIVKHLEVLRGADVPARFVEQVKAVAPLFKSSTTLLGPDASEQRLDALREQGRAVDVAGFDAALDTST